MQTERIALPSPAPGTGRELVLHRFGRAGARPKVWLQAALHADEQPGILVLHHLMRRLVAAEREGALWAEIIAVPLANPIGIAQHVGGYLLGRFALDGSGNFNRGFAELRDALVEAVGGTLGSDAAANVALVREAIARLLAERTVHDEAGVLKLTLQRLACDADIVLDLHCDAQSAVHIYTGPKLGELLMPLAARLGARAVLLAEDSGDIPFDEAVARPWWRLADACAGRPLPLEACLACTVELRGQLDIDDAQAAADADALYAWLQERGAIAGTPPPAPAALCEATTLDAVDMIRAPAVGLFVPTVAPGTSVEADAEIGTLVDPLQMGTGSRTPLRTRSAGVLFARTMPGLVRQGGVVAKVAGRERLPDRTGVLLEM
jgi:predicted deacylase